MNGVIHTAIQLRREVRRGSAAERSAENLPAEFGGAVLRDANLQVSGVIHTAGHLRRTRLHGPCSAGPPPPPPYRGGGPADPAGFGVGNLPVKRAER